ncbi:MAG: NAD(+) diphosphatase [Deltaproteobacteria bacterium]
MTFIPAVRAPQSLSARTRCFVVRQLGLVVRSEAEQVVLPELSDLQRLGLSTGDLQYLGRLNEQDCFALDAGRAELPAPWAVHSLRSLYGQLTEEEFAVAGRAVQIATFAVTHRFCGGCGQPTTRDAVERCVRCPSCDLVFYPRVSPAIIVLVRRGQEALLATSARFATGFYSTLAGFVEPGESLEQTLAREVFEEVGIQVANVRYFGSQPWPFPHSLMVGFFADYAGGDIVVDGQEILDARWFAADALPEVPPKLSIARQLIDAWLVEVMSGGSARTR